MTVTADAPAAAPASESTAPATPPTGLASILGSGDHKVVGRLWLVAALAHLVLVGGISVLLSAERIDTASFDVLGADWVVPADSFRFIAGVFLFVVPLTLALATAIVPLQVGAATIAFPRAAAAAAWTYLVGGGLMLGAYAIHGGPGGTDRDGVVLFVLAFVLVLIALVVAWICVATTVIALRAPGLRLTRVPLFAWSALVSGGVWILTLPVLAGLAVLSYLDARYGGFIDGTDGGLFARISWAFGTPTIYALAVPVLGFVGSVVPVFAQTRHHLHRVALGLIGALGVLSVGAWTAPSLGGDLAWLYEAPWVVVSIIAVIPVLGLFGLWAATVRNGKVVLGSPLLFAVVAALLALLGLLAGAVQAIEPVETLVDNGSTTLFGTSWSTGVTALLLIAGAAAGLGGVVYWAPKLLGSTLHEGGARLVALLVLVGAGIGGLATLANGLLGEPGPTALAAVENADTIEDPERRRHPRRRDPRPRRRGVHPARPQGVPPSGGARRRPVVGPHPGVGHRLAAPRRQLRLAARDHLRGPPLRRPPRPGGRRLMATVAMSPLATATDPEPRRPRVLLVGAAFGAAASALVVLSILAVYLQARGDLLAAGKPALPEGVVLPLTPGNMGMVTLLMSAVTIAWSVYALRNDDRPHAYLALGLTLLLGVAFINSTVYLYQQLAVSPTSGTTAGLLYAVTGTHLVMVFVGLVFAGVMGFQALGGQLTGRDAEGISAAALYWYATIAVYAVLWYAIYITK